jgi:diaminohydroxyphosphoribosylaminopyrimidine deaminase/5-amino-6-(5-phosphoribosylamino)uracil reductase
MPDAKPSDAEPTDWPTTGAMIPSPSIDEHWMRRALDLAIRGLGRVEPNPLVGCVVVCNGREIGHGWHQRFGGPHAEVNALSALAPDQVSRSDLYVTLEPCAHHGKTPPCLDLLLKLRPKRVIIAMLDPFPKVSGRGVAGLRAAGIAVDVGCLEAEARNVNAPYFKRLETGLPWVIAKWAMTLDGAIATETGDSKWITGEIARRRAHELRSRVDAIVVGSETVLKDDPLLTARLPADIEIPRVAMRIVIDRRMRIPVESQLVRTANAIRLCLVTTQEEVDAQFVKANQLKLSGVEILVLPQDDRWIVAASQSAGGHQCPGGRRRIVTWIPLRWRMGGSGRLLHRSSHSRKLACCKAGRGGGKSLDQPSSTTRTSSHGIMRYGHSYTGLFSERATA